MWWSRGRNSLLFNMSTKNKHDKNLFSKYIDGSYDFHHSDFSGKLNCKLNHRTLSQVYIKSFLY